MNTDMIHLDPAQPCFSKYGDRILKYTIKMHHKGLNEYRLLSAPDIESLKLKIIAQEKKWDLAYKREASIERASLRSAEALSVIRQIDNLLVYSLTLNGPFDWDALRRNDKFLSEKPLEPIAPEMHPTPSPPSQEANEFIPVFSFIEKIFRNLRAKKIAACEYKFSMALSEWEKEKRNIEQVNNRLKSDHNAMRLAWEQQTKEWEVQRDAFIAEQDNYNLNIDKFKRGYFNGDTRAILNYCEYILTNSEYPEFFPKNFEMEYNDSNKILILEYEFPSLESFPRTKDVKYVASKKELKESYFSETQVNKMFEEAMYKITLRTIHEIFFADSIGAIDSIAFNGWVRAINRSTGREETNCILSIQVKKDAYSEVDLSNVDPKSCFKNLKGVSSSKLSSLTPIQPIIQINKKDKRFIEGYNVSGLIDSATNLAAMDWEDFEHLIRELFEKEFQSNGGEVKVTQASRDGGVDAIAFDPDPIRGGKIVIQAKRYTNTVGVSSVRDLYGTILNEGATKGILVSTADYGPDAYEFAKGKPITLLNGSNLLHLLEKHGHHAKIDLKEAKKIYAESSK